MMARRIVKWMLTAGLAGALGQACLAKDFWEDDEEKEEYAGANVAFLCNPQADIYGGSAGWGVWIKKTPFYGDYFASLFYNGLENGMYAGLGMTVRVMPHWPVAPFIGVGGSYNPVLSKRDSGIPGLGDSYLGGHAESGVRLALPKVRYAFELSGRYTWSSHGGDMDYWLIGLTVSNRF